jgi:hypothetical protein
MFSQVFPLTEQASVIHKWMHVLQDVGFGGPVVTYWGYHIERSIGRMSRSLTEELISLKIWLNISSCLISCPLVSFDKP